MSLDVNENTLPGIEDVYSFDCDVDYNQMLETVESTLTRLFGGHDVGDVGSLSPDAEAIQRRVRMRLFRVAVYLLRTMQGIGTERGAGSPRHGAA